MSDEILRAIGRLEGKVDAIKESVADVIPRVSKLEKAHARAAGMFAAISALAGIAASLIVERFKGTA